MDNKLDIIIPAYNGQKYIDNAIQSILKQTIKTLINIYIINDGSDNNYTNFIKKYKSIINIKEITNKNNLGLGKTRQIGIDNSSSKYFMFIDCDDVFYRNDSIEILYKKINNNNNINVVSGLIIKENKPENSIVYTHGKIYRRSFINKYNIKSINCYSYEDLAFNLIIYFLCNDDEYIKLNKIVYLYNKNIDNSLTTTNNNIILLLKSFLESYNNAYIYAQKYNKIYKAKMFLKTMYDNLLLKTNEYKLNNKFSCETEYIEYNRIIKEFYQKYKIESSIILKEYAYINEFIKEVSKW
jgi:glycosyltransferase involved in cell wall biosynthesis